MDPRLAVLLALKATDGKLVGRTLLQKRLYFLNELLDLGIKFRPHYYGPYSREVADAVDSLVSSGLLRETVEYFEDVEDAYGDLRRYTYALSEDSDEAIGTLAEAADSKQSALIEEKAREINALAQANDYRDLSIAAKIHHIVGLRGKVTVGELAKEALQLGWSLPESDQGMNEKAVNFLKELGLVTTG